MTRPTIDQRITAERARRMRGATGVGTWHYWVARGDDGPPPEEHWCAHCAGWFGAPHDLIHQPGALCRSVGSGMCACIDCWTWAGRTEAGPAWRPAPAVRLTGPQRRVLREAAGGTVVRDITGTVYNTARPFPNTVPGRTLTVLFRLGLVGTVPPAAGRTDAPYELTDAGRAALNGEDA